MLIYLVLQWNHRQAYLGELYFGHLQKRPLLKGGFVHLWDPGAVTIGHSFGLAVQ